MKPPKEKAKELVDMFNNSLNNFDIWGADKKEASKQCALMCVDEMIKIIDPSEHHLLSDLLEVKKEIKQLK